MESPDRRANDAKEYPCAACGKWNRIPSSRVHDSPRCGSCHELVFPKQPVAVDEASWQKEVLDCPIPVLVDFWASWCGPCRAVGRVLEELAPLRAGRLKIGKLDVDGNPTLASTFKVSSIPMLALFDNGKLVDSLVGAVPRAQLESWLDRRR